MTNQLYIRVQEETYEIYLCASPETLLDFFNAYNTAINEERGIYGKGEDIIGPQSFDLRRNLSDIVKLQEYEKSEALRELKRQMVESGRVGERGGYLVASSLYNEDNPDNSLLEVILSYNDGGYVEEVIRTNFQRIRTICARAESLLSQDSSAKTI